MTVDGLQQYLKAEFAQTNKKAQRIARMNAAQTDPQMKPTILLAAAEFRRLGEDIDTFAASGNVAKLYQAMTAARWNSGRRIKLKTACYQIGLIDA